MLSIFYSVLRFKTCTDAHQKHPSIKRFPCFCAFLSKNQCIVCIEAFHTSYVATAEITLTLFRKPRVFTPLQSAVRFCGKYFHLVHSFMWPLIPNCARKFKCPWTLYIWCNSTGSLTSLSNNSSCFFFLVLLPNTSFAVHYNITVCWNANRLQYNHFSLPIHWPVCFLHLTWGPALIKSFVLTRIAPKFTGLLGEIPHIYTKLCYQTADLRIPRRGNF